MAIYHMMGFVCNVLICVNYASCRRLADFNSTVTLALSFQLTACVTVLCLRFLYPTYVCLCSNIYKGVDISASLPDPKGQRIVVVVYITMALQHFSKVTRPNILVDVVSSDHTYSLYNYIILMIQPWIQYTIVRDDFMRSHNLVIGLLRRYYCWEEKLMLHRNCALQTKPAVRYYT